ncbi:FAD:protein FMN transferase [Bifidobacterium sp. 82T10]|uniref:FAD:protein FMN transferase n=1 Tax=Bifidobacterium miconis TaxID=2834435 RepID=A0ABS6WFW1_9BIFI|nr:FAD:protein FMN transferase [Bifidobacterium miconis]MBW3092106.1 FAD:protein FMN transferase [Bifidobacterium miconis]
MSELNERMPYVTAFPRALGTGMIVRTSHPIGDDLRATMSSFIDDYERTLSRFRNDSTVAAMGRAEHGGAFDFPAWTSALFDLYDALCDATNGAIDPCVGEDLIRLGYGADYAFTVEPGADGRLGAIHGRPTWHGDVERRSTTDADGMVGTTGRTGVTGTTLITHRPVHLDFGACGKGYLVDLLAARFIATAAEEFVIDAGGDLLIQSSQPITIALEDPADTSRAIGTASVSSGAFCASAPSRRRWEKHPENGGVPGTNTIVHHLLNAIDGLPVRDVAATWVSVNLSDNERRTAASASSRAGSGAVPSIDSRDFDARAYPAALADGLATALFVADPNRLAARFPRAFDCAILHADRTLAASRAFPSTFFTRQ